MQSISNIKWPVFHILEHMEITQRALEQFVVLAEELHVGRAAERLSMTQPPLSQSLHRLERAVGVALFERGPRGLTLTAAGRAFLNDTRQQLLLQRNAIHRARRAAGGEDGEIHLGFVGGTAYRLLPDLLRRARAVLPGLTIHLHQAPTPQLIDVVRSGVVDLALVRTPAPAPHGLELVDLPTERLAVAMGTDHPLAQRERLHLSELAEHLWVLPSVIGMGALAARAVQACHLAGFTPKDIAVADSLSGLLTHVASAGTVTLVPESVADVPPRGVTVAPLLDPDPILMLPLCAISRVERADPALERLRSLLPQA